MSDSDAAPNFEFGSKEWDIFHLGLETTPLIRSALDQTCSRFSFTFVRTMQGVFISNDFALVLEESSFTPHGDEVVEAISRAYALWKKLPATPSFSAASASLRSAGNTSGQLGSSSKLLFGTRQQSMVAVAKKRKSEVVSGESFASPVDLGKAEETASKTLAAQELLMVLPLECRCNLCPSSSTSSAVAGKEMAVWLVMAICKMGAVGTLQNCKRQLAKLGFWLERNYQQGHAFAMPPGVLLHYLAACVIGDGLDKHVPAGIKDGLVFGAKNLLLGIPIQHSVVVAFCRTNHKLAQSAVSTSGAMFLLFYHFATAMTGSKWAYPFAVRYVATCCMVWCIAAIRSIDCQRAKILGEGPEGAAKHLWLAAACWDSKKKCAFVWLVPLEVFGSTVWVDTLTAGWKKNDFMFCNFDAKRGAALRDMPDDPGIALDKPASPHMVQKWIRELFSMPRVGKSGRPIPPLMSPEDAQLTTRYGNRHLASNVVRCGDASLWPPEVKRKVSGWGSISEMPDRYSQETADLENFKIRVAILDMIWKAVQRTPEDQWPAFGGWHLFSRDIPVSSRSLTEIVEHHGKDVDDVDRLVFGEDLAASDVEEFSDDDDGDDDAAVSTARGRPRVGVPAG